MALAYLFDPNKQFQDRNGVNNVAGFLRVYYEGTDDRATTYKNFIGTLNPADIPIDNDGRAVVIVEGEKTYRLEVYTRNGNLQWTQHPLCPLVGGGGSFEQVQSNWKEDDPTSAAFIKNKPDIDNGRIHRLRPARDEIIGETSNYDGWVLDLESPNESAPGGYDRLTPQRLKQILDDGEFLVLETYQSGAYVPLALQALVTVQNENPLQISVDFVRQYESYNLLGFERMQIYTPSGEESYLQIRGLGPRSSWWQDKEALAINGDGKDVTVTFSEASARTNISTGEKLSVLFGKVKKFFTDLASVAFSGSYNDLSDKPTIPAAQVNSDWNAQSGVEQILNKPNLATVATSGSYNDLNNKPDLTQYIPSSQKGAANGVGTLDTSSLQPFEQTYNGYFVENNVSSAKVVKIGRFKGSNELRDSGGASFSVVFRSTNQASGQALLWVQKGEYNKTDSVCRKVVLFNRPNSGGTGNTGTSIQFYKDDVLIDGVNYVDVYMSMQGYATARITPLWMNRDMAQLTFSSESVELPQTAVIIDDSWFVRAPGIGAGDADTPVYVAPNGVAAPCNSHNHDLICQLKPIVHSGQTSMRYILCDRQKYTIENNAYVFQPVDVFNLATWINRGDVIQIDGAVATDPWGDRYPMQITEMQCSLDSGTNKLYCTNIGVRGYAYSQTEITRWGDTIDDEATNTRYLEFTNWT